MTVLASGQRLSGANRHDCINRTMTHKVCQLKIAQIAKVEEKLSTNRAFWCTIIF